MCADTTGKLISQITEAGLFERLASAVLREANPNYKNLIHTGVNELGQTIKSPVDGICFIENAHPRHMVAFHHATGPKNKLEKKWLHDPSNLRKSSKTPPGDVIKTIKILEQERISDPSLKATLVLTSNNEPTDQLVREVSNLASKSNLNIDIWSRSRISHFLDFKPEGQWIRSDFFNEHQTLLSNKLLKDIATKSLKTLDKFSKNEYWVQREIENKLTLPLPNSGIFISAESGFGKTVLCYRILKNHIQRGGYGIVLDSNLISNSNSVDQAVNQCIERFHPNLSTSSPSPFSYCYQHLPFLIIIDDINHTVNSSSLINKVLGWLTSCSSDTDTLPLWNIICPVWNDKVDLLGINEKKLILPFLHNLSFYNESEGISAITLRAKLEKSELSELEAKEICVNASYDPLLVNISSLEGNDNPGGILEQYIESSINITVSNYPGFAASDYLEALKTLGTFMLESLIMQPTWADINTSSIVQEKNKSCLLNLIRGSQIINSRDTFNKSHLNFRHDRVKIWVLSFSARQLLAENNLKKEIISDPYYSEIIGHVLVSKEATKPFIKLAIQLNPLALFHAFNIASFSQCLLSNEIIESVHNWLDKKESHKTKNNHLRWYALSILAQTQSLDTINIVNKFKDKNWNYYFAKLRNGDFSAAVDICADMHPGVTAIWRDQQINHAIEKNTKNITLYVSKLLKKSELTARKKSGLLRLAGYIGDSTIANSILICWENDKHRVMDDYFWAFAHCCKDEPEKYLKPICDFWENLSNKRNNESLPSPRESFASDEIRFAFHQHPPIYAIDYLVSRASCEKLEWPILYLINGIDHISAILFVVDYLTKLRNQLEKEKGTSHFLMMAGDVWRRSKENNRPMSRSNRNSLKAIWNNVAELKNKRKSAYQLWEVNLINDDIDILNKYSKDKILSNRILISRLKLADYEALEEVIRLIDSNEKYEHYCFYLKSFKPIDLADYLERFLTKMISKRKLDWGDEFDIFHTLFELIIDLPSKDSEKIILKFWDYFKYSPSFLQSALYVATPELIDASEKAIKECESPNLMMTHVSFHIGYKHNNRKGLTEKKQFLAFAKYFDYFSSFDLESFWNMCNERGWYTERKIHLDDRINFKKAGYSAFSLYTFIEKLNSLISDDKSPYINNDIDYLLKTEITWDSLINEIVKWFESELSITRLEVVCDALIYKGSRKNLQLISTYKDSNKEFQEIIEDTIFAVKMKSPI